MGNKRNVEEDEPDLTCQTSVKVIIILLFICFMLLLLGL